MRKGISLVALVITIIVLIILTAAVFLTGADVPANAELSVFLNDVGNVQDAVVLQIAENLANKYDPDIDDATRNGMTKFDVIIEEPLKGILSSVDEEKTDAQVGTIQIDDDGTAFPVYAIEATPEDLGLSISQTDLAKYVIDEQGTVYYWNDGAGKYIDGKTYYKTAVLVEDKVEEGTTDVVAVSKETAKASASN